MKRDILRAAVLGAVFICATAQSKLPQIPELNRAESGNDAAAAEETLKHWPEASRLAARQMLARYGAPSRGSNDALVWLHNGPWEKTVARRDAMGVLEQTIGYRVPDAKVEPILKFDARVEIDQSTNELAARSGSERVNFLLLNLADDIVTEKRSAEDAKAFYAKALQLSAAGKSSQYLEGFLFEPPNEKTVTP